MKFKDLSVKDASNKAERILLDGYSVNVKGADPISLDGQWVEVVGTESDAFKEMDLRLKRDSVTGTVTRTHAEIDNLIKSCLISAWSFEEPCTEENIVEFLELWPSTLVAWIIKKAEGRVAVNFTLKESKI
jgi:hypothetical protein